MTEEEITWTMPAVGIGTQVLFYPYGALTQPPHLGFVARVNQRSVDVWFPLGQTRGGVRFCEDPVMAHNEELRKEYGLWDYTYEHKAMATNQEAIRRMEAKLKTIEELLEKKTK